MARADEDTQTIKLRAAILSKVFAYDRTLSNAGKLQVFILGSGASKDVAEAFKSLGVSASPQRLKDIETAGASTVIYELPGASSSELQQFCEKNHLLSVAGDAGPAERGEVSVGIGLREDGRPQIVVNLARSKAEGHELSSELLRVSRVIR